LVTSGNSIGVGSQYSIPSTDEPLLGYRIPLRSKAVEVASTDLTVFDEPGLGQQLQMLADGGPAHRKSSGQVPDCRRPIAKQLQDAPTDRLTQRVKDGVRRLVTHR
jgi:hypothetical protein